MNFILCSQSFGGILHASLSQNIEEGNLLDDGEIEMVIRKYFKVDSYYMGDLFFNLLPNDWDKLERKLKIERILL